MGTVFFTVVGVFSVELLLAYQVSTACVADWAIYLYCTVKLMLTIQAFADLRHHQG